MSKPPEDTSNNTERSHNGIHIPSSQIWTPPVSQSEQNPTDIPNAYYGTSNSILSSTIDYSGNQYSLPPPLLSASASNEGYEEAKLSHSFPFPAHLPPLDPIRYFPSQNISQSLGHSSQGLQDCPSPRGFLNLPNPPNLNSFRTSYVPATLPPLAQGNGNDHSDDDGDSNSGGEISLIFVL